MLSFPYIKINLGLHILARRPDGYHDIETVFYPLPVMDALEAITSEKLSLITHGLPVPGDPEDNLCMKAWNLLKKDFPELPPVRIHLLKNIPVGAGLGGGSSDAAFMIRLLDEKFQLGLGPERQLNYAQTLGSDCPFFIRGRPCLARGRGEILEPVALDLGSYSFVVVCPPIPVSTAWAYTQVTPSPSRPSLNDLIRLPVVQWKERLVNDFEVPVFRKFPAIGRIKAQLYSSGALYASLSGSGSALFGIFPKNKTAGIAFDTGCRIFYLN